MSPNEYSETLHGEHISVVKRGHRGGLVAVIVPDGPLQVLVRVSSHAEPEVPVGAKYGLLKSGGTAWK